MPYTITHGPKGSKATEAGLSTADALRRYRELKDAEAYGVKILDADGNETEPYFLERAIDSVRFG
jgi:hypothetical protein